MPDFSRILEDVPEFKRYMTVDELHQRSAELVNEHPGEVELIDLGRSASGEIIDCVKVGEGRHNALIHGFPNCEEPFGGNLLDYMSWALAEDDQLRHDLDYTWYLVKCSDPDGARLNEGFQVGPHTPMNFTLNYYRTPNALTPESCFPFRFGPLDLDSPVPETRALMRLMDRVPLSFVSSLHMMKWGGVTYEVPHPCPELYAPLWEAARMFSVFPRKRPGTTIAPGVMRAEYLTPARGYLRHWAAGDQNIEPIRGCYIYEYGQMLNPSLFMMIPECCIWFDPRMWDDTPGDTTIGESLAYARGRSEEADQFLLDAWSRALPHLKTPSPFRVMMEEHMEPIVKRYTNVSNPPFTFNKKLHARPATEAERIGIEGREDLYRMFYLGGLIRTLDAELDAGGSDALSGPRDEAYGRLQDYDNYLHDNYTVIAHPIRNLVGMGLGALLHSAVYAKRGAQWC